MTRNLRTLVAAITIALCVTAAILAGSTDANSRPSLRLSANCKAMLHIPSYRVTLNDQGEGYRVQSGKTLVRKAVHTSERQSDLNSQCRQLVLNYANDLVVIEATR